MLLLGQENNLLPNGVTWSNEQRMPDFGPVVATPY